MNKGSGDNPAIALLAVLGSTPPVNVTINEMTTVASVWTHAQFLDGTATKGHTLGLKIAAGNVPNFVDLATGGWGSTIQDSLNSSQTPTMANFATLADVLAGCVTRVTADACSTLFAASTPPKGAVPTDTPTQQDRIWVTNGGGDFVIRFPASDPSKVEKFKSGFSGSGLGIDSQGNVCVMDNWQDINSCYGTPPEGLSTRCGGQGVTIFFGMAKPVRAPQIGPAQAP